MKIVISKEDMDFVISSKVLGIKVSNGIITLKEEKDNYVQMREIDAYTDTQNIKFSLMLDKVTSLLDPEEELEIYPQSEESEQCIIKQTALESIVPKRPYALSIEDEVTNVIEVPANDFSDMQEINRLIKISYKALKEPIPATMIMSSYLKVQLSNIRIVKVGDYAIKCALEIPTKRLKSKKTSYYPNEKLIKVQTEDSDIFLKVEPITYEMDAPLEPTYEYKQGYFKNKDRLESIIKKDPIGPCTLYINNGEIAITGQIGTTILKTDPTLDLFKSEVKFECTFTQIAVLAKLMSGGTILDYHLDYNLMTFTNDGRTFVTLSGMTR